MEMHAPFHRQSRLQSTFSKDGIHGSLHLAAANAISTLLSSGARATGPYNGARNAGTKKTLEELQENRSDPFLATIAEIFSLQHEDGIDFR